MDTATPAKNKKGFVTWAIVIAIVVVLNLFFNYAISLVYKAPTYEKYFPTSQEIVPITNKADCLAAGGQWTNPDTRYQSPDPTIIKPTPAVGYCDPNYTKQMQFAAAQKAYSRTVFIILVVLGVLSLVLGAVLANTLLILAFSWGGVLSLVIASVRYWSDADNLIKVLILGAALGALIWIAVRKFGK